MEPLRPADPQQIGPYRLVAFLGSGGFGQVYIGYRPGSSRPAAVKLLSGSHVHDLTWRRRFNHEVDAIRKVGGVVTAQLLDAQTEGDEPWLATAYIAAPTLGQLVHVRGAVDEKSGWWLLSSMAEALLHIHSSGLLHRDLKPQNVLVAWDGVKVIDFGISRLAAGSAITQFATWAGTREYMPPEQFQDMRLVTAKSDVYALAATQIFALTRHPPYTAATYDFWLQGISPDLDGVPEGPMLDLLRSCLAKNPDDRPTVSAIAMVATEHFLSMGIIPPLDGLPPLAQPFLDAIAAHAAAATAPARIDHAHSAGPPPIADGPLSDGSAEERGGFLMTASSGSSGSQGVLGRQWSARWNEALDERRRRYDG